MVLLRIYRPIHEVRFRVLEDLKGNGQSDLLVVVRGDHTYVSSKPWPKLKVRGSEGSELGLS